MKRGCYIGFIMFFCWACSSPPEVRKALKLAGENKKELEKVLAYYQDKDRLRYEAACFLIANMPYHKSDFQLQIDSAYWDFFRYVDSVYENLFGGMKLPEIKNYSRWTFDSLRSEIGKYYDRLPECRQMPGCSDVETVTADFLIDNIEEAFKVWETSPLLKGMAFSEFKEIILPYRTAGEPLLCKRSELRELLLHQIDREGMENIYKPLEWYKVYMAKQKWLNGKAWFKRRTALFDLRLPQFKMDCHNLAAWTCNYFRACGIPVAYEYTEQWPDKDARHFWCASPDSCGVWQPYTPPYNNLREDWDIRLKYAGKVYRRCFGICKDAPYFLKNEREYVPKPFDTPLLEDVTDRYHRTVTLRLPYDKKSENYLAYLCFFSTRGLHPVAWGKVNRKEKEVVFEQVPVGMLFFPVYYEEGELENFGYPFLIKAGRDTISDIREIRLEEESGGYVCKTPCDAQVLSFRVKDRFVSMHLLRKYPYKISLQEISRKLNGGRILGANVWKGKPDTLCILTDPPRPYLQEYELQNRSAYRYYYFERADRGPVNIAELEFLTDRPYSGGLQPTPLPVFSESESYDKKELRYKLRGEPLRSGPRRKNAFDGNMLTYVESVFIGMDFKRPVRLSHVRLAPRNADNMIVPGNTYELFYFDAGEWKSCGKKKAEYNYLFYPQVPEGSIYWLRNCDYGKEELPFFYLQGQQKFINEYLSF